MISSSSLSFYIYIYICKWYIFIYRQGRCSWFFSLQRTHFMFKEGSLIDLLIRNNERKTFARYAYIRTFSLWIRWLYVFKTTRNFTSGQDRRVLILRQLWSANTCRKETSCSTNNSRSKFFWILESRTPVCKWKVSHGEYNRVDRQRSLIHDQVKNKMTSELLKILYYKLSSSLLLRCNLASRDYNLRKTFAKRLCLTANIGPIKSLALTLTLCALASYCVSVFRVFSYLPRIRIFHVV